jgi:hypothetical protein
MKLSTLFLGGALVFNSSLYAQQTPWDTLPATKKMTNINGEEETLRLKLDTLIAEEAAMPGSQFRYEVANWYKAPSNKFGYGYVTKAGKPFGIWRYYVLSNNKYELFCEGYLENLAAGYLVADPEYADRFASANSKELKESFVNSLEEKSFFTGEWRFYKNGKLAKIVILDKKVTLPLMTSVTLNDAYEVNSTQLLLTHPVKKHLSGLELSSIYFSPEGMVTYISANGVNLKFAKNGKPVIEPLLEPTYHD